MFSTKSNWPYLNSIAAVCCWRSKCGWFTSRWVG